MYALIMVQALGPGADERRYLPVFCGRINFLVQVVFPCTIGHLSVSPNGPNSARH